MNAHDGVDRRFVAAGLLSALVFAIVALASLRTRDRVDVMSQETL